MPNSKNQTGLAPIVIVLGLLSLGVIGAGGYYTYSQQNKPEPIVQPAQNPTPSPSVSQGASIEEVKELHEDSLLNMEGVEKVDVGEKDGKPCVVVFTFKETNELQNLEDNGLEGYEVKIENTTQTE